jgi:hypothetical protein
MDESLVRFFKTADNFPFIVFVNEAGLLNVCCNDTQLRFTREEIERMTRTLHRFSQTGRIHDIQPPAKCDHSGFTIINHASMSLPYCPRCGKKRDHS